MFELDITKTFSAAHSLVGYDGPCSQLHGHNWTVQVFVHAEQLNELGISLDFTILKKELMRILNRFDHHYLNDLPEFSGTNPTSENIARFIYTDLAKTIKIPGVWIAKVRVCESPTSGATYWE